MCFSVYMACGLKCVDVIKKLSQKCVTIPINFAMAQYILWAVTETERSQVNQTDD